jgi:hypothetical protein
MPDRATIARVSESTQAIPIVTISRIAGAPTSLVWNLTTPVRGRGEPGDFGA